jgi:hypothetical protein
MATKMTPKPTGAAATTSLGSRITRAVREAVTEDWYGPRYFAVGLIVAAISGLVVAAFYVNHPQVDIYPDTPTYLRLAKHIWQHGPYMDAARTPGYPLLIDAVFAVAGWGNLAAVSVLQGFLFVLAALEAYFVGVVILRKAWMAAILGLLLGINLGLLSYVKPVLSEGLDMFLVVTLALTVTFFVLRPSRLWLWLVALETLALWCTRPEWVYLMVPLFAWLLVVAGLQRGRNFIWRLLPHAAAAVIVLYALVGVYIVANGAVTGYRGLTDIQNINLLGKVMQYHMQLEAPPQYASQAQIVNTYVAAGKVSPWTVLDTQPQFTANHFALAGAYATSVVTAHPVEFVGHTLPLLVTTLGYFSELSLINPVGPLAKPLTYLNDIMLLVHRTVVLFPLAVLLYLGLMLWPRTRRRPEVQMMAGLVLIAFYDLGVTAFGAYSAYPRFHMPFEPLMLLAIWGTVFLLGSRAFSMVLKMRARV